MAKILIVEDNSDVATIIEDSLSLGDHSIDVANDGSTGKELLSTRDYDLVVLDWVLPEKSGLDLCREHRQSGDTTPIMMLSAKSHIDEKEKAFEAGADDYMTKPFHVQEFMARVRALLRRPKALNGGLLSIGEIVLDCKNHKVTRGGEPIKLYPRDFALLEFLMRHPNQIFAAKTLLDCVWRSDSAASVDTVRQCLMRLRNSLKDESGDVPIRNIHGVGYRLENFS